MTTPLTPLLRPARAALLTERSDRELLDSFVRYRDEDAFADVVRRHGPMVLGVCRRVLRNHPDADDAFQAAFLVLARRAAHLASAEKLANWLHGVAFNTARKLRHANLRRARRELPLDADPSAPPEAVDDSLAVLDEELNRLPEKYRATIVLCDLEGRTRSEAARTLGVPEGTVAGRLARARERLATALASRGVVPAVTVAAVPNSLVVASARTAAGGVAPSRAAALADGVISAMFRQKLRPAVALVAGFLVVGVGVRSAAQPEPPPPEPRFKLPGFGDPRFSPPADEPAKSLTAFPLGKLSPEAAVKALDKYAKAGAVLTPVTGDRTLLIYADEKMTRAIEIDLEKFGERRCVATAFRLHNADPEEVARTLREVFNGPNKGDDRPARVTVVPVKADGTLLVYATQTDTATIRQLLGKALDPPKPAEPTFTIEFRNVAWADVFDWYAKVGGLPFVGTVKPTGTCTLVGGKDKKYTLAEVTDLLNEILVQQQFLLVRREKSYTVIPADEKPDPSLFRRVELDQLPKLGKTELVEVVLPLKGGLEAKEIADEVKKMLGPFGQVQRIERRNDLIIRDTAANILRIQANLKPLPPPKP